MAHKNVTHNTMIVVFYKKKSIIQHVSLWVYGAKTQKYKSSLTFIKSVYTTLCVPCLVSIWRKYSSVFTCLISRKTTNSSKTWWSFFALWVNNFWKAFLNSIMTCIWHLLHTVGLQMTNQHQVCVMIETYMHLPSNRLCCYKKLLVGWRVVDWGICFWSSCADLKKKWTKIKQYYEIRFEILRQFKHSACQFTSALFHFTQMHLRKDHVKIEWKSISNINHANISF